METLCYDFLKLYRPVLCDDLKGWMGGSGREAREEEDTRIHKAGSCTVATNTTL